MPVAGAIKYELIADAEDRASTTLRQVRSELKKNEEQIHRVSAAGREDADISDILARGSERTRRGIVAEVAAREAAAQKRRDMVTAAREARTATEQEASALGRLKGGVEGASRGMEFFNKALGVAGFAGAAVAAVGGLVELVGGLGSYRDVLELVEASQARFNALLAELQGRGREFEIGQLNPLAADVERARDELAGLKDDYLEQYQLRQERESVLVNLSERARQIRDDMAREDARGAQSVADRLQREAQLDQIEREAFKLRQDIAASLNAEALTINRIKDAQERSNVPLQSAKALVSEIEGSMRGVVGFAGGLGDALKKAFDKVGWNPLKGFGKTEDDKGGGGASRAAMQREREQGLERELALARAATETDRLRLEREHLMADVAAKKISAREAELRISIQQASVERELAESMRKIAEDNEQRAQREADEAERRRERQESDSGKDEAKRLEERARAIESIGDAARAADRPLSLLSGRLGGLSAAVEESASLWANYERGQQTLGDAISGTLGIVGHAVGQAISDKQAQAGVEGAFEAAASIASFASGNIPAGLGHAAAASAFFAVAAGAGGGGGASGGSAGAGSAPSTVTQGSFGQQRPVSARPEDARTVIIVQSREGFVYGMGSQIAQAASSTARSLRRTNMDRRGW